MQKNQNLDPALKSILTGLKDKNEEFRIKSSYALGQYVEKAAKELSGESFSSFIERLTEKHIQELVNSRESHERLGGILAIDKLIDLNYDDPKKITLCSNYLRNTLTSYGDSVTVTLVAKTLGKLAKASATTSSKTLTAEWVDFECKRALEWLEGYNEKKKEKEDEKRFASLLVITELAKSAPTLFYAHVSMFFLHIWKGITDVNSPTRQASISALRAVLALVSERSTSGRVEWYHDILSRVKSELTSKKDDRIHGGLLVIGELLRNTGSFMLSTYDESCEQVLQFASSSNPLIRTAVIGLIPQFAKFNTKLFTDKKSETKSEGYLYRSVAIILSVLKANPSKDERSQAYISLGEIAMQVGTKAILKYNYSIIQVIKDGLSPVGTKKVFVREALRCCAMLARAVGKETSEYLEGLLDSMFGEGLTNILTESLAEIVDSIPGLLIPVQERLLDAISFILAKSPYNSFSKQYLSNIDINSESSIVLALLTLWQFNFKTHNLTDFVSDCVVKYLDDESSSVRREAVRSCCKLLVPKTGKRYFINDILEKLLTVCITDPEYYIRLTVLQCLDDKFDHYLALSDNLRLLFIALNDENFSIREVTMTIIGRLSTRNPAFVLPSLRKTLIQLLTELEFSEDTRNKEESARMLGHLISAAPRLIKPYVPSIFRVLKTKITDTNPNVSAAVMESCGKLSLVGGEQMEGYTDILIPLIIETLQDQSSTMKREVSVRTLGQLVRSTGNVVTPYLKYPKLLSLLLSSYKGEEEWSTRHEIIKVLGTVGAVDPYKYKSITSSIDVETSSSSIGESLDLPSGPSNEDYFPTVVITALMKILKDSSLSMHHGQVIQGVTFLFRSLGMKCVPFLPHIVPPFISLIRTCEPSLRNTLFQQLSQLVSTVRQHIKNYIDSIFTLIQEFWPKNYKIQIINLEEQICKALNEDFKLYLSDVIPQLLGPLTKITDDYDQIARKILDSLLVFGKYLEDYLYLVVPAIVRLVETGPTTELRIYAIRVIGKLSTILNLSEYSGRIIHPLCRILREPDPLMRKVILDTLCVFVTQMRYDYAIFVPLTLGVISKNKITEYKGSEYEDLVQKLLKNSLPEVEDKVEQIDDGSDPTEIVDDSIEVKRMSINIPNLKKSWEATHRSTKDDWNEWIRGFSVELLKESPNPALRACRNIGQMYHPLARELFNVGFVSCWSVLDEKSQSELVRSLEMAFSHPNLPTEVLSTLLNLAEFMEHDDKPLPISISALGILAEKCAAYAKALHHKEIEFQENPASKLEELITINNQLGQHEAAMGLLVYAQKQHNIELKENWYEKLQRWKEAYDVYEKKQLIDPYSLPLTLGRMRCLKALGEWEKLYTLCGEAWERHSHEDDRENKVLLAPMGAIASWNLQRWKFFKETVGYLDEDITGSFYQSILSIHEENYPQALLNIEKTRKLLDSELGALVRESYARAYDSMIKVVQLSEMEEIIEYKLHDKKRDLIKRTWRERLKGCQRNVEHWQDIMAVRSLVLNPLEQIDDWMKFSSVCRKAKKLELSEKTLISLGAGKLNVNPKVEFEYIRHIYDCGQKNEAFKKLEGFVNSTESVDSALIAQVYLLLGQWQYEMQENQLKDEAIPQILSNLKASTLHNKDWYKAWHSWALMNTIILSQLSDKKKDISQYLVSAITGYFKSISLSPDNSSSKQDILRLLTLWFQYGDMKQVEKALVDGFNTVSIDTWLEVIPQLIARIASPSAIIRKLIHDLLSKIGQAHPQALIYPLTVSAKSQLVSRKEAAETILDQMRSHSAQLVEQALLVSHELIRTAILWIELWNEGLEEASKLYFGDHDIDGMIAHLEPLHVMIQKAATLSESSFVQNFGRDLQEAWDWCKKYKVDGKENNLTQAWDIYYHVFRRIGKQLQQLSSLELQYVSPKLLDAKDLKLALPGTYKPGQDIISITSFAPTMKVLTSKQRPRRLKISGSNGVEYSFLLKGHEDLRQDERVMQLFGLVNTLLKNDRETSKRDLDITRYAVIPLSSNAGLIGWVENTDTLHVLIKEYRESRNIVLDIEHKLMKQMATDYDHLSLIQKIEVFEYALENTTGQDVYKVLWLKSKNSEIWLDRRTNYTRSLAVMSMVGYILGLGDRHPSNLMLEKYTGKVVHIDFGDCFEVAMLREKYPEKIPFRLTRMLVNAMEVSQIEGTFRSTCESVMLVLREHKDSVMAMLEAFVHDPLINWRLVVDENKSDKRSVVSGISASFDSEEELKPSRSIREKDMRKMKNEETVSSNVLNRKAVTVIERISSKLHGKDFDPSVALDVPEQVNRLIESATSNSNLCQCYIGWCAWW